MRYFLLTGTYMLVFLLGKPFSMNGQAQAFNFNTFFTDPAIAFFSPDSNNMIYPELHNVDEMVQQLDSIFPFDTNEFYGAYPGIQVSDSMSFLPGLHQQIPGFDNQATEVKGAFTLNNKKDYWYAYYKKSTVDTTTAIIIFPGSGFHESFLIANTVPGDYHNMGCLIKNKDLAYGDVFVIVKPNEDFRSIWKDINGVPQYNKLDYDVMGPYTDYMGRNWAANLYIELLAQIKYLQSKYKKVIVTGLSSGGFPVLVCGLEAGADGINCASGISVSSYTGFPVPNNENPYFSDLFDYYSLEHISDMIHHSGTSVLFSYGSGDCCTNDYEYGTHSLQNYLNSPLPACNALFFYNFSGHTFRCAALDDFYTNTIQSPTPDIQLPSSACAYDSLQVSIKLTGVAPYSMDLYKDGYYYSHYNTADSFLNITLYDAGEYYLSNVVDVRNHPLCRSKSFYYVKPATQAGTTTLMSQNSYLVAKECPYMYYWYKDAVCIDSTIENILAPRGSGEYYVLLKDSAGCIFKSNIVTQNYPYNINIYPNPAQSDISILINGPYTGTWVYSIYNNLGQHISSGNSTLPHALVNIRELSKGMYYFSIEYFDTAGKKVRKTVPIIKQ